VVITSLNRLFLYLLQEHFGGIPWVLSVFWVQSHDAAEPCSGWWHIHVLPGLRRSVPSFVPESCLVCYWKQAKSFLALEVWISGLGSLPWDWGGSAADREVDEMSPSLGGLACWTSGDVFPSHAPCSAEVCQPHRPVRMGHSGLSALGGRVMLSARLGWKNRDGSLRGQIQPCFSAFF